MKMDYVGSGMSKAVKVTKIAVPAAVLVVVLGLLGFIFFSGDEAGGITANMATAEVVQGPLVISVSESGTLQALEQEIIKNEVEGQTAIIYLVPEGEKVKKGDLLVELDASQLQDQLVDQQIIVQNAEAAFINARETLGVTKNQAESDVSSAELTLQFAKEDLVKYTEGDYPNELKDALARITLAEAEVNRTQERLAGSQRLFEQDFITAVELEADKQSAEKARLDQELAVSNKDLLEQFTYKRRMAELESAIEEAERALERAKLKASADVVQAEAALKAKEAELEKEKAKLAKTEEQIKKTKIYAPRDGLVVYATTSDGGWRGNQEPLEEGQQVRERQELIYLPTADSVMAEVKIHEANIGKIGIGMPAQITVDALPGKTFMGKVAKIAPLPDAQSAWLNPDLKVYDTQVNLTESSPELRTGMNCRVEILVERYDNATYVPVQAVMRIKGVPTVHVVHGNDFEPKPVEIGLDNNRMINIISGLEPGETVLLTPPLAAAERQDTAGLAEDEAGGDGFEGVPATDANAASPAAAAGPGTGAAAPAPGAPGAGSAGPGGGPPRGPGGPGGGFANMTPEQREEMRKRFENMTPEQMQEMRDKYEKMTPEEREKARQQFMGGGGDAAPSAGEPSATPEAPQQPPAPDAGEMQKMRERFENMTPEQRDEMRKRFENMTPEQMQEMREKYEKMTPEEREKAQQDFFGGGGSAPGS